jgi:hypothetical protein
MLNEIINRFSFSVKKFLEDSAGRPATSQPKEEIKAEETKKENVEGNFIRSISQYDCSLGTVKAA